MIRTYSELIKMATFEERFNYLALNGRVGKDTFGYDRYLNQMLYKNVKWRRLRDNIIIRDNACDLALPGYEIFGKLFIHHMNPLTKEDIENDSEYLWNPEYLVCVSFETHNAIHYGNKNYLEKYKITERRSGDTVLWK